MRRNAILVALFSLTAALPVCLWAQASTAPPAAKIDAIFSKWNETSPGCTVGVAADGQTVLERGYGMADLEREVRIVPETIFEAGSVSKQFTAAGILLLVKDGKLSLDDEVRKYIPELPDYGAPLKIRHMLNHTSGLRDWGSVEGIAGWPRTSRVYTHGHVLDIVSRQRALNFPPGTRWSYSNTGYNLAAIIVSRVSGMPFAEFERKRLFEPLGMTHTSWRDDHTRIVKGRAIAYSSERDGYHILMPFENIHGNGGLLTTVGDLLRWNENFATPKVGDAAFVQDQQTPGRFNDGRAHEYALGLEIRTYKGLPEVEHSGSTAGYRAHLVRYPDQHLSVAVLCNVTSGEATQYAHAVADLYLADRLKPAAAPAAKHALSSAEIQSVVGLYRNRVTGVPLKVVQESEGVRIEHGPNLIAASGRRFETANHQSWDSDGKGGLRMKDEFGSVTEYERVPSATPSMDELKGYVGTYTSSDAETVLTAAIEGDALVLKRRPDTIIQLTPVYAGAFNAASLGTVIFRRDSAGRVIELSISQDRVWDLRFSRHSASPAAQ